MASLELRKNGIWHIRYYDKRGKLRSKTTKIKTSKKNDELAKKKLEAFERELRAGSEPSKPTSLSDLLDDVISEYTIAGRSSLAHAKLRIENHVKPWFGSMRADRATAQEFRDYIKFRLSEGAKNGTINRELSLVSLSYSLALRDGKIDSKPYIPKLKEAKPRTGFFERSEFEAVFSKLPEHYQYPIYLEYVSGWRTGSIRQMEPRCIDFDSNLIRLDPGSTKNEEGPVCPMDDETREKMEQALEFRKAMVKKAWAFKQKPPLALFLYIYKNKVRQIGDFRKAWIRACYDAGIPCETIPKVNPRTKKEYLVPVKSSRIPHDFRRTAVRNWTKLVPDRVAMGITGHKTREVFDRYNIVSESDMQMARERRNSMFAKHSQDAKKANAKSDKANQDE